MRISDWSSDVCSSDFLLLKGDCDVVLEYNGDLAQAMDEDKDIDFVIPKEGSQLNRSEERRVGKGCVSKGKSRWSPVHDKKQLYTMSSYIHTRSVHYFNITLFMI